jgi:metallo-beta-lactamase class B
MLLALILVAQAQFNRSEANAPREPFRVVGNIYSVGAAEVTSFLITSPKGHVLLDGGLPETAPQIERNVEKLGFKLEDVKILLLSHAHFDHAGGLAELKRRTGAQVVLSLADSEAVARGGKGDPQYGDSLPFPRVFADRVVQDQAVVRVGPTEMVAHLTPGHTKGCTSWTTVQREEGREVHVLFTCSLSAPEGTRLVGNSQYPRIVEDYERSFRLLRGLPCDVLLGPHASFFHQDERHARMAPGAPNPFIDPPACVAYLDSAEKAFRERLEAEKAAAPDAGPAR